MSARDGLLVALVGQQNAGKSTLFNLLTGTRQHVANYPGVTVDKKYGLYHEADQTVHTVDLPGTYGLTSFSLEERVAREFLLDGRPDLVVDVVDAANLRRSLHLTLQLLEMERPLVLALNMMDVAARLGLQIDAQALAAALGLPVVPTIGRKGEGREALRAAIRNRAAKAQEPAQVLRYNMLEDDLSEVQEMLAEDQGLADLPRRWLALKLLEGDEQAQLLIGRVADQARAASILREADERRQRLETAQEMAVGDYVAARREERISELLEQAVNLPAARRISLSERIDRVVLNRFLAPVFLILTVFLIYQLSIVYSYELTSYTWPLLAGLRELVAGVLPAAGFLVDPYVRSIGLWLVDSANTLLNYVPIFLILFALIAVLEDSGYMARIAFILDKVLHRFGLHGQSTLPLILGGVFASGCAVPGVVATKGIPDQCARMATILTVPFMNCLAKVPLYTLLLGIFFVEHKSLMMFYIATLTLIAALLVAKLLTVTVLEGQETAPFVMELPHYHLPTLSGVLRRAFDRTWLYIRKVGTIVVAVAVVVFSLLQFPGLSDERMAHYRSEAQQAAEVFYRTLAGNPYLEHAGERDPVPLLNYFNDFKRAKLNAQRAEASRAANDRFATLGPDYYPFVRPPKDDKQAKKASRALRKLAGKRKSLRRQMKEERITRLILGSVGRGLEPVTRFAGFDWKINVALLSSFAARESSVATLGVLFLQSADENKSLEERMGAETKAQGATALLAVAMILFFALYPPCLATSVMIKVQTGSYRWMLFSILFPTALGLGVASLVFSIGMVAHLSGIQMMSLVYALALALLLVVGLAPRRYRNPLPGTELS